MEQIFVGISYAKENPYKLQWLSFLIIRKRLTVRGNLRKSQYIIIKWQNYPKAHWECSNKVGFFPMQVTFSILLDKYPVFWLSGRFSLCLWVLSEQGKMPGRVLPLKPPQLNSAESIRQSPELLLSALWSSQCPKVSGSLLTPGGMLATTTTPCACF